MQGDAAGQVKTSVETKLWLAIGSVNCFKMLQGGELLQRFVKQMNQFEMLSEF